MNTATQILTNNQLQNSFWGKKITAAEKRGGFTESNERLAKSWVTCACGKNKTIQSLEHQRASNQTGRVGLYTSMGLHVPVEYEPQDDTLRRLGQEFYDWIESRHVGNNMGDKYNQRGITEAARVLVKIEERAAYLLDKEAKRLAKETAN